MYYIKPIPYQTNSRHYFDKIRDMPHPCWLDSGQPYSKQGRYDILAASPKKRIISNNAHEHQIFDDNDKLIKQVKGCAFDVLKEHLPKYTTPSELPFIGGFIGYLSYDLGNAQMSVATKQIKLSHLPDMHMCLYKWSIIQDHLLEQSWLAALPCIQQSEFESIFSHIEKQPPSQVGGFSVGEISNTLSQSNYHKALKTIEDYIHSGDCYQINFTQFFTASYEGDSYLAYLALREAMASPFSAYIKCGQQSVLSLSPERFIQIHNKTITTSPIKGTIKRSKSPKEDQRLIEQLKSSIKDRAENVMIVDLLRNDIGKNCIPGSIQVPDLFAIESFPNVHHMVSHIQGQLHPSCHPIDALADCFPGGSITGAPKKRAMEIIAELEPYHRSVYCGSIGYINQLGDLDMNIAIRTVLCDENQLYCAGGGGIVADSNPNVEYEESLIKINRILQTLAQFYRKPI